MFKTRITHNSIFLLTIIQIELQTRVFFIVGRTKSAMSSSVIDQIAKELSEYGRFIQYSYDDISTYSCININREANAITCVLYVPNDFYPNYYDYEYSITPLDNTSYTLIIKNLTRPIKTEIVVTNCSNFAEIIYENTVNY